MAPLVKPHTCIRCGSVGPMEVFCYDCREVKGIRSVRRSETQDAYVVKRIDGAEELIPRERVFAAEKVFRVEPLARSYDHEQKYPIRRCGAHGNPDVPTGPCSCQW